ncbi:MAG: HD-GYP domain-containing protein [Lachnospiraceae bacterium]|nr:HD-GYP domain-containing protein [Lachnospiraceae bacterium]
MRADLKRLWRSRGINIIAVLLGIAANSVPSFLMTRFGIPLYLDTIGTIGVSILGGMFPGIVTAVATNTVCSLFDNNMIYFGCVNVLIAIWSAWFAKNRSFKKLKDACLFVLVAGLASGISGAAIEWWLSGDPGRFLPFFAHSAFFNVLDKGLSLGVALAVLRIIPKPAQDRIRNSGWRQRPLSADELKDLEEMGDRSMFSLKKRLTVLLLLMSFLLVAITGAVGARIYFSNSIKDREERARNAARFAAKVVDADRVDEYILKGEDAPGYADTEELLYDIRENAFDVRYLYVVKVEEAGSTYVFDLDDKEEYAGYANADDDLLGYDPGYFEPLDESLEPYMEDLLSGEEVLVETRDAWGWMATAYHPVLDEDGSLVCYACADTTFDALIDYTTDLSIRIILILSSFFVLILAFGFNMTRVHVTYPTNSIILAIREIIEAGNDQERLDRALEKIRSIEIHTGDELEKVYHAFCDMATEQVDQIRGISMLSENTMKMQDGLINTMADLVENRDSDTGSHVQKTSAYVKIIVEGLKMKGYYSETITHKFISDVVRSAPLHDIGKINIPDDVLNKPGRLNQEEYEIMKTHTVAGKKIMEKAIETVGGENYLMEARNMAAYHHERWDGTGYPEKLRDEEIPLSARIMAVADVFDALTSRRVYKPAFPLEKAVRIIEEGSGKQFDPKCVEVFLEAMPLVRDVLKKYNGDEYPELL